MTRHIIPALAYAAVVATFLVAFPVASRMGLLVVGAAVIGCVVVRIERAMVSGRP